MPLFEPRADKQFRASLERAFQSIIAARGSGDNLDLATAPLHDAFSQLDNIPSTEMIELTLAVLQEVGAEDGLIGAAVPPPSSIDAYTGSVRHQTWKFSDKIATLHENYTDTRAKWVRAMGFLIYTLYKELPPSEDDEDTEYCMQAPLIETVNDPYEFVSSLATTFHLPYLVEAGLFAAQRTQLDRNLEAASKELKAHDLITPERKEARKFTPQELIDAYVSGTMLEPLLRQSVRFSVPLRARFEHTHIVGGTGHGKTQLMQTMILRDLNAAMEGMGSLVVMDSQGDLLKQVSHLKEFFDPTQAKTIADKIVMLDATDVEYPICLNMFAIDHERMQSYSVIDRERMYNATVDLYEYIFGALLGAELTQKQGVIFKFIARLMFVVPSAQIETMIDLMENAENYAPYIDKLDPSSQRFFRTEFPKKAYDDTKDQIARRLWGVLSNTTLARLFSNDTNKVDFFELLNSGKIILINTSKDLLQPEGSAILGRFFVAMIAKATMQRASIPEHLRRSTFFYIDEAQEYIDENIEEMLNQARKYRVGMVLAHQHLDQLNDEERGTIAASTSVKFAGGLSAKDARFLAPNMRTEPEVLLSARKSESPPQTEFACFIKNVMSSALKVTIPLGVMSERPQLSAEKYQTLVDRNRARFCVPMAGAPASGLQHQPAAEDIKTTGGFELGEPDLL